MLSGTDDLWQMDLADLSDKMDENDDYRFMLTVIDVFSRWAWAEPVKTKSGPDEVKALTAVFHRAGVCSLTRCRQTGDLNSITDMLRSYSEKRVSSNITLPMIRTLRPVWF